jgi:hypothetical protein
VQDSKLEVWRRSDVEELFGVNRVTAHTLMRAIGDVQNIARNHLVDRAQILDFFEEMIKADNIEEAYRGRLDAAKEPPKDKGLKVQIPEQFRTVVFETLPPQIKITPGKLEITGDGYSIVQSLGILARALTCDSDTIIAEWNKHLDVRRHVAAFVEQHRSMIEPDPG